MDNYEFCLKQDDGSELSYSTFHIEEDVLRMKCGLEPKEEVINYKSTTSRTNNNQAESS